MRAAADHVARNVIQRVRSSAEAIAAGVGVLGLINIQFALAGDVLYVLEANPRSSRTVPFVAKATSVPLAKAAARISLGATIAELRVEGMLPSVGDDGAMPPGSPVAVKEVTLPWSRFRTIADTAMTVELGPEMRSTGEVMGIDESFGAAFAKSQAAVSVPLPTSGRVLVSVADRDIRAVCFAVRMLVDLGFAIVATLLTAPALNRAGIRAVVVAESAASSIAAGEIDLVVSTNHVDTGRAENLEIRAAATTHQVPCLTTVQALTAAVQGIASLGEPPTEVRSLQEYGARLAATRSSR